MRRKLLLVVDDWEALEVYENLLDARFELEGAPFGSEGVRRAGEWQPDRIFIDLVFEDMTPAEACEKLRADPATARIPLTVVFSQGDEPYRREGVFPRAGDQVLRRPFDLQALPALLAHEPRVAEAT